MGMVTRLPVMKAENCSRLQNAFDLQNKRRVSFRQSGDTVTFGLGTFTWDADSAQQLVQLMRQAPRLLKSPQTLPASFLKPLNQLIEHVFETHPSFPEFRRPEALAQIYIPVVKALAQLKPEVRDSLLLAMALKDVREKEAGIRHALTFDEEIALSAMNIEPPEFTDQSHNFIQELAALSMDFASGECRLAILKALNRQLEDHDDVVLDTLRPDAWAALKRRFPQLQVSDKRLQDKLASVAQPLGIADVPSPLADLWSRYYDPTLTQVRYYILRDGDIPPHDLQAEMQAHEAQSQRDAWKVRLLRPLSRLKGLWKAAFCPS